MTNIKLIIKGAQHRLTVLHIHYYSQDSSKIFFLPSHIVYILCFVLFGHVPSLFESHRCAHAQAATAIPTAIFARCPLRIEPCMVPIAQCLLPTTLCPSLTAHYPLPTAWPGGMRGAIEYGQPLAGSAVLKAQTKIKSLPEDPSRRLPWRRAFRRA